MTRLPPFVRQHLNTIQLVLVLIVLCITIYSLNPRFLSVVNLSNLLGQMVTILVVALGMTIIIINGEFDISVGSLLGLTGAVMGWFLVVMPANGDVDFWQQNQALLIVLGVLVALTVGPILAVISGLLVTQFNIPSFIVTLGMLMIARSLTLVVTGGQPIAGIPDPVKAFGVSRPLEIPLPLNDAALKVPSVFLVAVAIYVLGWFLMSRMAFGRKVYAVGANPVVARLAGINTTRIKLASFAIVGLCASIAGVLNVARIGAVSPNSGQGLEFEVIAAVVIGGTSLSGGRGNVLGTILGVIIIVLIRNFLNLARIDIFWQDFATGAIIMGAVILNALQKRLSGQAA
ncbi:ABC transporter permease [Marinovum sp. 2_MG-2023]|uniref:ABC transporter permease n=1 Tax=unclassified Marinovum TaxID=2647166 RepID=UPI0026E17AC8|nr:MULTISPECIES: ABC transporter permease [unclassified Marinovum]MDO6731172.1 ABC transporter permease [Marinovum sp. 2_MG-2023]MDO6778669.1 ABC transporter permease [Marinovum sp. 1_MG-2023]